MSRARAGRDESPWLSRARDSTAEWAGQRLPEILLPRRGGLLAVLEAYFDESDRYSDVFCVAGYIFDSQSAKKFDREWRTLIGARWPFHMVDLVHGKGRFKGMPPRERDALLRAIVSLINQRVAFGIVVSCRIPEVHRIAPRWIQGFGHAYSVCCHFCMTAAAAWVTEHRHSNDRLAYLFEAGHQGQGEAGRFIAAAAQDPEFRQVYRYAAHGFILKKDSSHVQSADVLAWEWTKAWDESVEHEVRPVRRSLQALLRRREHRYLASHITGRRLAKYMEEIRTLALNQLREEGHGRERES